MSDFVGVIKASSGHRCKRVGCPNREAEFEVTGNDMEMLLCRPCFHDAYPVLMLLMLAKGMIR